MIWTRRYNGNRRAVGDQDPRYIWNCGTRYKLNPEWQFPLIRNDHLVELLVQHYRSAPHESNEVFPAWWHAIFGNIPMFEWRGGGYHYYDLRIIARFAPRPFLPSMWRCSECNKRLFRRDLDWWRHASSPMRYRESRECSKECADRVLNRVEREMARAKARANRIERRRQKRREAEWEKIKEGKNLLKQIRSLLKHPREVQR